MDKRSELRRIKKEFAIKFLKENKEMNKKKVLLKLMSEFNMSKRYTKEILEMAEMEIEDAKI